MAGRRISIDEKIKKQEELVFKAKEKYEAEVEKLDKLVTKRRELESKELVKALFDMFSGRILDVKDKKEKGIHFFFQQLDDEICKDVTLCVVPSHQRSTTNESGIACLARRLANNGRIDKVDFLLRKETIDKLAHGGSRDIKAQLDSIYTNDELSVSDEVVLIVDDVTTSGASLEACNQILMEHGAKRVAMLALGQSV